MGLTPDQALIICLGIIISVSISFMSGFLFGKDYRKKKVRSFGK